MAAGMAYGNQLMVNDTSVNRRSSHISNSNMSNITLKSGYSPIDDIFYKTGIRGPKKYTLYIVIFILFIIALGNILTTFVLLGVLHLGYGMQSLEFIPSQWVVRVLQSASIETIIPLNGIIGSFEEQGLHIIGNNQPVIMTPRVGSQVLLKAKAKSAPELEVNSNETIISNVDFFKVVDPSTGKTVFSTESIAFGLSRSVRRLRTRTIVTNKLCSPINTSLSLNSNAHIKLKGNEGMHITALELILSAGDDVYLKSRNSSILLNGRQSIILSVNKMPQVGRIHDDRWQYKICVCMPNGKLFKISTENNNDNCEKASSNCL